MKIKHSLKTRTLLHLYLNQLTCGEQPNRKHNLVCVVIVIFHLFPSSIMFTLCSLCTCKYTRSVCMCPPLFSRLSICMSFSPCSPSFVLDVSESLTWRYSFVFTAIDFRRIVRITPQSEERTCINVPILNPNATFCLDNGYRDLPINNTNGTITISSDQEVQVHGIVVNNAGKLTGSFLVLPIDYLGTRYVIPDYYRSDGKAAQVAITAIFNDTEVEVMCDHFKGNRSSPITLHANESTILSLSMLAKGVQDINRTEISSSDKPISVVISSKGVIIPYNETSLDHGFIIEQLLPVLRWGQLHFMPPFQATQSGSLIRVLALEPDTNITRRCGNTSVMPGDASEQSQEFQISGSELCVVAASKPVQVMQYMMSSTTQEDGDASMLAVLPVKEYHGKLTFAVHERPYQVTQYADIIIVKQGIELLRWNNTSLSNRTWHCTAAIDGNPAGQPSTEYCYLHLQLETGVYHVNHRNQSQRFWLRLYAHNKTVGAAMLGGVVLKSQDSAPVETVVRNTQYTFNLIKFDDDHFDKTVEITPKTSEGSCIFVSPNMRRINESTRSDATLGPVQTEPECLDANEVALYNVEDDNVIVVRSSTEVSVLGLVTNAHGLTGAFFVLSNDYLGTEYLIDCYTPTPNITDKTENTTHRVQVVLTAIHENTTVSVNCTSECTLHGTTFGGNVSLSANETATLQTKAPGKDMTGTYIKANKPISVVVGSTGVYVPLKTNGQFGVIMEQLLPISNWGRVHIVPPFYNATSGWIIRAIAFSTNTRVALVNCGTKSYELLDNKQYLDVFGDEGNGKVCIVKSDKPIQVVQYMASTPEGKSGDPSMSLIPPVRNYHGSTIVTVVSEHTKKVTFYADVIVTERGKDGLLLNGTNNTFLPHCFNLSRARWENASSFRSSLKGFCHFRWELQTGVHNVTHTDQSERFLVRIYAHNDGVGAASLVDINYGKAPFNVTTATTTSNIEEELTDLFDRLNDQVPGDFENFNQAEEVMTEFNSYLGEKDELESVDEMDMAFSVFTGVLSRQPLKTATADDAKSFINLSSSSINVIFSQGTTQLMENVCSQGTELGSSPEQVQRRLEEVMREASSIIVEGGVSSFESDNPNAALDITSTGLTSMSSTSLSMSGSSTMMPMTAAFASDSVCESTGLEYNGVTIPCEVLKELRAEAAYRVYLPHAGQAVALSNCSNDASKRVVATPLVGIGLVSNLPLQNFSKNISISLAAGPTVQNVTYENAECNFWDYATSSWSTSGCFVGEINGKEVTCLCNHLTSFAVLLKVSSEETPPKDEKILEILTWIGCIFSILSCFLTCAGYAILRLRSDLILIHGNLALALGLAQLTFLFIDLVKPESTASCTAVATLVYYLFLVMFAWMSIEGIHLYLLTFVVWNAEKRKIKYYLACAWGIPMVFVIVLLSVHANDFTKLFGDVCFLTIENYSLLFFAIPIAVVIVFNVFVMSRVVYQIAKMADGPTLQSDSKTRAKHGVKALVILLPIMGLTWVFGFLTIEAASLAFQYLFVIFNSLQGVFIFLIHFVRNSEVCHAIRRRREKWMVSHSSKREYDYRVKTNTKKSSSTGGGEKTSETFKTPDHTMTLTNLHTDPGF